MDFHFFPICIICYNNIILYYVRRYTRMSDIVLHSIHFTRMRDVIRSIRYNENNLFIVLR